jgi:hypothetical protein
VDAGAITHQNENWLHGMDSNHDNLKQRRIYKLQTFQWSKMAHWTRKPATPTKINYANRAAGCSVTTWPRRSNRLTKE